MTITEFLLARISEREAMYAVPEFVLVDSAHGTGWGTRGDCTICDAYMFQGLESVTGEGYYEHLEHAHQRTLVLAECEVKRRIVAEHPLDDEGFCYDDATHSHGCKWAWPCPTLRALASVYADHPDFQDEWRIA